MFFTHDKSTELTHTDEITQESFALITEGMLLENASSEEISNLLSDSTDLAHLETEEVVTERTIVRLDKKARINQAQKIAVFTIAKERNDPKFKKLLTVWRLERTLEAELFRKYGNEGLRRAKKVVAKNKKSRSNLMRTVAQKADTQFNKPTV